jgi:hypothetical protein
LQGDKNGWFFSKGIENHLTKTAVEAEEANIVNVVLFSDRPRMKKKYYFDFPCSEGIFFVEIKIQSRVKNFFHF